jgi:hypothetical protein
LADGVLSLPEAEMTNSDDAGPRIGEAFQLRPYIFYRHPLLGSTVFWQESCVDFLGQDGEGVRIWLANVSRDTWVNLADNSGQPLPVSVYWDGGCALLARWLSTGPQTVAVDASMGQSDPAAPPVSDTAVAEPTACSTHSNKKSSG